MDNSTVPPVFRRPGRLWPPRVRWGLLFSLPLLLFVEGAARAQELPRFRLKEEMAREHFKKAMAFYNSQNYVAAREFFYKSLNVNPFFHLARRYLGDAYYYSGDWNGALEQWESLEDESEGAYPLVRMRSELLRFQLSGHKDPGDYTLLTSFTAGQWRGFANERPVDVALGSAGETYVLYYKSANVLKISAGGEAEEAFRGPFYDRMKGPMAMALYHDLLYICDFADDRVRIFDLEGHAKGAFGGTGGDQGKFHGPSGIAVTAEAVFVSDAGNRRIQKFSHDGSFIASFGADESGIAPENPAGIFADDYGNLFVADMDAPAILMYDTDGNRLMEIHSDMLRKPHGIHGSGDELLIADEGAGVLFYNRQERGWHTLSRIRSEEDRPFTMNRPLSVRSDESRNLYVAEFGGERMTMIVPRGLRIANLDMRIQRVDISAFPEVAVFLTVRNRLGHPLPGISRSDVFVFENDSRVARIRTDNIEPFNHRTNITIVQENSELFAANFRDRLDSVTGYLTGELHITDRLRVVRAGQYVREVFDSKTRGLHRREILRELKEGETAPRVNLGKAMFEGITSLLGDLGPRAVVLIVSGTGKAAAFDQYSLERVSEYARAHEIRLYVVSTESGDNGDKAEMRDVYRNLAASTDGRYYAASDETGLKSIYSDIRSEPDHRYLITYKSALSKMSERYADVRVEMRNRGTVGTADGGYFVP